MPWGQLYLGQGGAIRCGRTELFCFSESHGSALSQIATTVLILGPLPCLKEKDLIS